MLDLSYIGWMMKPYALALAVALATPAVAQTSAPEPGDEDGFNLMEEGARLLLRGLMQEMEPGLDEFRGLAEEALRDFGPAMRLFGEQMGEGMAEVLSRLDDIRNYEAPVILENGDILIRRRPDAPAYVPPAPPEGEIDL